MIEFENVSFSYTGQEHGGLHDINLKISDGECVLFCGRSGCGKTTITRLVNGLIPQFYQGELHGRVLVDGQEISNIPMYQIAAKVGSVFQNPRTQFFNVDTDSEIAFGIENPNPRTCLVQIKCGVADWGVMAVAVAYLIFELCVRGGVIG